MRAIGAVFLSWLFIGPFVVSAVTRADTQPPSPAAAIIFKPAPAVGKKGVEKRVRAPQLRKTLPLPLQGKRLELHEAPPEKLELPIVPKSGPAEKNHDASPARRHYIEISGLGLLIGDYHLEPRLALGTDNRLDDVNIRERALRDEMDARESQRRGEVHEDPISAWLRTRGQPGLPGVDPGFQVAFAIQRMLHGNIRLPNFLDYAPPPRPVVHQEEKR